jgi:hypothetical protein
MATWYLTRPTPNQLGNHKLNCYRLITVNGDEYISSNVVSGLIAVWCQGSPNEWTLEFDIKRSLQDSTHEVLLGINSVLGAGATLTWQVDDGNWELTNGSPDANCGIVAINTWCHVKITVNRTTKVLTVQIDDNEPREYTDTDNALCEGIYFTKIEGDSTNKTYVKNFIVNYARPVSTSPHLLMWSSVHLPDIANTVNVIQPLGQFINTTIGTKEGVNKAITLSTVYNFFIKLHGNITSSGIIRFSFFVPTTGEFYIVLPFSSNIGIYFTNGNIRWNSLTGNIITTYPLDEWFTFDLIMTTSGTNTLFNARVNIGDWGNEQSSIVDLPITNTLTLRATTLLPPPSLGPNIYLLNEGWITPTLTSPTDITMTEGDAETLSWTPTGDGGTYSVTKDGVEIDSGAWTSGVAISVDLSTEGAGIYSYVCTITDTIDTATDTVEVTVASGFVPPNVGSLMETGIKKTEEQFVGVPKDRILNDLAHEPDNIIKNYRAWRQKR